MRVSPSSRVLVLTMHDEPRLVRDLLALGAHAYIVKSATREELLAAVRTIVRAEDSVVLSVSRNTAERLRGRKRNTVSDREPEVLLLAARAMSTSEIASRLHLSEGTVKRHFTNIFANIFAKLGTSSRAEAARKALSSGLISFRDLSEPDR